MTKVTNQSNPTFDLPELHFDGIETTMMSAANSQLRFFVKRKGIKKKNK